MSDRFTDPSFLGSSDRHLGGRNALVNQFEKDLEQFEKWEDYYNQERYTQRDMVFVDGSYKLGYHEVVNEKPVFEVVDPAPEDRGMLLITCIEGYVKGLKQDGILPTLKLFNEKITECKSYKDHSFVALFHELEAHNPHKLVLFSILEGIFELKDELSYNSQAKRQTMHELALEIDAHHFTQTQLMKKDLIDLPNRVIKAHKGIRGIFAGLDISRPKSDAVQNKRIIVGSLVSLGLLASVAVAFGAGNDEQASNATPAPLKTYEAATSTLPETTTTLLEGCATEWVVKQGDTLFDIARRCGVSLGALKVANQQYSESILPLGVTLNIPDKDFLVTLPSSTVEPTTEVSTTITTLTTSAPEVVPPDTAPPDTKPPGDGILPRADCIKANGNPDYVVVAGDGGLIKVLEKVYSLNKVQATIIGTNKKLKADFHLNNFLVTSVAGYNECLPTLAELKLRFPQLFI